MACLTDKATLRQVGLERRGSAPISRPRRTRLETPLGSREVSLGSFAARAPERGTEIQLEIGLPATRPGPDVSVRFCGAPVFRVFSSGGVPRQTDLASPCPGGGGSFEAAGHTRSSWPVLAGCESHFVRQACRRPRWRTPSSLSRSLGGLGTLLMSAHLATGSAQRSSSLAAR
jgi:hypothetical protein